MAYRKYWVGLDTGVSETAVCLIDEFGEILFEGKRETNADQIKDILRAFGVEAVQRITIEAGVGTHMVRNLQRQGFPVYVTRFANQRNSLRYDGRRPTPTMLEVLPSSTESGGQSDRKCS